MRSAPPLPGTVSLILRTPFAREVCLLSDWCDVSRHTLLARLAQRPGAAVAVVVGGAAEAVLAEVGSGSGERLGARLQARSGLYLFTYGVAEGGMLLHWASTETS